MESLIFKCGHSKEGSNAMPRGDGKGMCCRICKAGQNKAWRKKQPLERFRKQKERLRIARMAPLLKEQNGKCAICERELKHPYEDHNHGCCKANSGCDGCRRGLLCPSCNAGLNMFESKKLFHAALSYLAKWDERNN